MTRYNATSKLFPKAMLFALAILVSLPSLEANSAPRKKASSDPLVIMETSKGPLKIQIYAKDMPITSGNFADLVSKGFYNGLKFHRYEPGFIIQGGDPQNCGSGVYVDPTSHEERKIPVEQKLTTPHNLGTVSMARTSDPNSASCQFYICLSPQPKLDSKDPVFGMVVDGLPTLNALRAGDKIVKATLVEAK